MSRSCAPCLLSCRHCHDVLQQTNTPLSECFYATRGDMHAWCMLDVMQLRGAYTCSMYVCINARNKRALSFWKMHGMSFPGVEHVAILWAQPLTVEYESNREYLSRLCIHKHNQPFRRSHTLAFKHEFQHVLSNKDSSAHTANISIPKCTLILI